MSSFSFGRDKDPVLVSRHGYVEMNGVEVWNASRCGKLEHCRGINILEIDPFKCTKKISLHLDTFGWKGAAGALSDYLQKLVKGSVIVGVSADEPRKRLDPALPTLNEFGVNVADVKFRGSFAFIAQKSYSHKTLFRKVTTWKETRRQPAHFKAIITGIRPIDMSGKNVPK